MTQAHHTSLAERIYRALLIFYPAKYRREYGPWMVQVFRDMSRTVYRRHGRGGLARWWLVTFADLVHTAIERHIEEHALLRVPSGQMRDTDMTMQKWGSLASFVLAISLIIAPMLYFVGNWRDALGMFGYNVADLLFGPVTAVSFVTAVIALRERIGKHAERRTHLALMAAVLAGAMFVIAVAMRSTNRQYILHMEANADLSEELSNTMLMAWGTIVPAVIAAGRHFMGWSLIMTASAGLSSKTLPAPLCIMYLVAGIPSLFAYMLPIVAVTPDVTFIDGLIVALVAASAIWQAIVMLTPGAGQTPALEPQPEPA